MIKTLLTFITLSLILTGCARFKSKPESMLEPLAPEPLQELPVSGTQPKGELLYQLLAAELAGQRGDYALALDYYTQVAEKVPDVWVVERAARIALYLKDDQRAREMVSLWLERAPDSPKAHKAALLLALKQQDVDSAGRHFIRLLELTPDTDRAGVLLDILRFMDGEVPKEVSLQVMAKVSGRFASSPEVLYAYAMLAIRQGETRLALTQVSRAVELRPDWPKLRLMQSQLLTQLGETGKAREVLQELVEGNPENLQLRLLYAQLLLKLGEFSEAEKQLKLVLQKQPDHPDALYAYALLNIQKKQDDIAEKALLRLLKQPKWRSEAYYYLGRIASRRGDDQGALKWFWKITEGNLVFDAHVNAIAVLAKMGETKKALAKIEELRERYPDRKLQLYLLEAEIYSNREDYQTAFSVLTEALTKYPAHPDLLYARALIAEKMGRPEQAISDLRAALAKQPEDPNLLNALGYTLLINGVSIQEAKKYLEQAVALRPNDPAILDSYGWLWYKLGDYSKALGVLQRAYAKNQDAEIAYHLGEVLWSLGRKDDARQIWSRLIQQHKSDPRVKGIIEQIGDRLSP